MSKRYVIKELQIFAKEIREVVALSFEADDLKDIDEYISINQVINIINEHALYFRDNLPVIDEETLDEICLDIKTLIFNVGLSKLAAKGLLECSWSDKDNEFVFWIPKK